MSMTIPELLSVLSAIGVIVGLIIQFRKYNSDAYKSLLDALNTSGQTIGDLMKMIAEMPTLREQLSVAVHKISELESNEEEWNKERNDWKIGIARLIAQLVSTGIRPDWLPRGVDIQHIPGNDSQPSVIKVIGEIQ